MKIGSQEKSSPTLSVVVPARNEEAIIANTIERLKKVFDEIIIVDNGSTDRTKDIAQSMGVTVLEETRNVGGIGYGFAHMLGIENASGDYIIGLDSDGQHPIEQVPEMISYIELNEIDFISCGRTLDKNRINHRSIGGALLSLQASLLLGVNIQDVVCGMWVFRKDVKDKLQLVEGGWEFSVEIKLEAATNDDIAYEEYPIITQQRTTGTSHLIAWKGGLLHAKHIFAYAFSAYAKAISALSQRIVRKIVPNSIRSK